MRFLFLSKKHQTSTFAHQRDLGLWLKCAIGGKSLKNIDNNKTKARQVEKREATKASQTHKRQAKRRDEWTLLPQIYWPGLAKVQLRPPGLQFRPLPPSNPVISRDAWGQGESWDVVWVLKHNELRNILDSIDKVFDSLLALTQRPKRNDSDVFFFFSLRLCKWKRLQCVCWKIKSWWTTLNFMALHLGFILDLLFFLFFLIHLTSPWSTHPIVLPLLSQHRLSLAHWGSKSGVMLRTSHIIHGPTKSPPELIFSKWMPVKTFRAADVSRRNLIASSICSFARKSARHDSDN